MKHMHDEVMLAIQLVIITLWEVMLCAAVRTRLQHFPSLWHMIAITKRGPLSEIVASSWHVVCSTIAECLAVCGDFSSQMRVPWGVSCCLELHVC